MRVGTHEMNKHTVTKRIIQTVAVAFGLMGLMWISMSLYAAVAALREPDRLFTLCMQAMVLAMGGFVVAIAWLNLRRFGPTAIKHVVALVVLLAWSRLMILMQPFEDAAVALDLDLLYSIVDMVLLVLVYLSYRFLSRKLIALAGVESSPQAETESAVEE